MSIARATGALVGTSESSGVTITNTSTATGSEVDVLGDSASTGTLHLWLIFTSTVTAGSLDVYLLPIRASGTTYDAIYPAFTRAPVNGTRKYYLGTVPATRYMSANIVNNATGASATNVSLLYELHRAY